VLGPSRPHSSRRDACPASFDETLPLFAARCTNTRHGCVPGQARTVGQQYEALPATRSTILSVSDTVSDPSRRLRPMIDFVQTFCTKFKTARQAGRTRRDQGADTGRSADAPRPGPPYRGPPSARAQNQRGRIRRSSTGPPAGSLAPGRVGPSTADQASRADQPAPPQTLVAPLRLAAVLRRRRPARSPEGGRRRTGLCQQGGVKHWLTSHVTAGDRTVQGRRTSGDAYEPVAQIWVWFCDDLRWRLVGTAVSVCGNRFWELGGSGGLETGPVELE
jgi:hypothetical protein